MLQLSQRVVRLAKWSGISCDSRRLVSSPLTESVYIIFLVLDLLIKGYFLCYHNYYYLFIVCIIVGHMQPISFYILHALSIPRNAPTDLRWRQSGEHHAKANFGYYEVIFLGPCYFVIARLDCFGKPVS